MARRLPVVFVSELNDLQLLALFTEPHNIEILAVDAVHLAPHYLAAIEKKLENGWRCDGLPHLRRLKRFCDLLAGLGDRILPKLLNGPSDRAALRSLRTCWNGMWNLRRRTEGAVFKLTGLFSNSLTRAAREALNPNKAYELSVGWIKTMADRVDECRGYGIVFQPQDVVPPSPPLPLPTMSVSSIDDLHVLTEPHSIDLISLGAVRLAPHYLAVITDKEASGWVCIMLPHLRRLSRFSELLASLQDILPRLLGHPDDRGALRKLRSCGRAIWSLRRNTPAGSALYDLAGRFSNNLTRSARHALNSRKAYTLSAEWIQRVACDVEVCLNTTVVFQAE